MEGVQQFSLAAGGPFHVLLARLRLLGADELPAYPAALVLALYAWLPPALLSAAEYLASGDVAALSYFTDYTAYIRGLVAIPIMITAERTAHLRLTPIVDQFFDARLIAERGLDRFKAMLKSADEWSSSRVVEGTLVTFVVLLAIFGARLDIEIGGFDWDGRVVDGEVEYSMAGAWSHWLVKPLFQFLVLRWIWRFAVWGWLLFQISRLPLRLISYHPDRSGGLGFLSVYPMVFSGLVFAMSSVVAAQLVSVIHHVGLSQELQWYLILAWIVFVLLVFVGPLAVFAPPLYRLREQAIFRVGRIASEHHQAFQRKWLESDAPGSNLLGSEDVSSTSDLGAVAETLYSMRLLPVTIPMIMTLAFTAGLPMLAVVATQMPLGEFLGLISTFL